MSMLSFWRWIKGYKKFRCKEGFVERFINLCTSRGINIWDVKCSGRILTGCVSISQADILDELSKNAKTTLEICETVGLPVFINNNKKRKGLAIGALIFFIILKVFSMFIWSVEITGLETLSEAQVKDKLSKIGLCEGMFKSGIDQGDMEQKAMSAIPDIAWISLNIHGSVLSIEVSEREKSPDIVPSDVPCNVKAKYSGQIVRIGTKAGTAECAVGNAVVQGQVIISGIMENKFGGLTITHADGTVIANTSHTIEVEIPLNYTLGVPKKEYSSRSLVNIMGFKTTVKPAPSPICKYYSVFENEGVFILNNKIPVSITTEYLRECYDKQISLSKEKAEKNASVLLELNKLFVLNDKTINDCSLSKAVEDNSLKLTAVFDCTENICYKEKLNIAEDIELSMDSDNVSDDTDTAEE